MLKYTGRGWWSGFLRSPADEGGGGGGAAPAGDAGAAAAEKPAEGSAAPGGDSGSALGGGDAAKVEGDGKGAAGEGKPDPTKGSALGGDGAGDGDEGADKASSEGDETPDAKIARLEKELAERSAPEAYEPFELGDGWVMSEEQSAEFTAWAKERNLSQPQAQAALEQYTKQREKDAQQWWDGVKAWREKANSDPEIGGQNRQEALRTMREARDMFGADPELRDLFETAGIGDNPALQRFFYRVGKHMGLGKTPTGQAGTPTKSTAELLYGNR